MRHFLLFLLIVLPRCSSSPASSCDENQDCPEGQYCIDGTCIELSCEDVQCQDGYHCIDGLCYLDECSGTQCTDDEVCIEDECVHVDCVNGCDDGDPCTDDRCENNSTCVSDPILDCLPGDGCCPVGCLANEDSDCVSVCGNGEVEPGETCDPPETCPADCDDLDPCTQDTLEGSSDDCNARCQSQPVSSCLDQDGCCPPGCDESNDDDCSLCGNGVLDPGETCDPPASCPADCDDGDSCTVDVLTGTAESCTAECSQLPIDSCENDDGCCLPDCTADIDNDCDSICGNQVVEPGETCDPPDSCPSSCEDADPCTEEQYDGSPDTCDAVCTIQPITSCGPDDGCCPEICSHQNDPNCEECACEHHPCSTGCCPWEFQIVADGGGYISMDLDTAGHPHISFDQGSMKYATWDGSAWDVQIIENPGANGMVSDLELDSQQRPCIAYEDGANWLLRYATWTGSQWEIETVEPDYGGPMARLSLDLDAADQPHLVYTVYQSQEQHDQLQYAHKTSNGWEKVSVDSAGTAFYPTMELDDAEHPHIAYIDYMDDTLHYARFDGVDWHLETVGPASSYSYFISLALDGNNHPHVVYTKEPPFELLYASFDGVDWDIQTAAPVGYWAKLHLDDWDRPHIIHSGQTGLEYVRNLTGVWEIFLIECSEDYGSGAAVATDANGHPQITYWAPIAGHMIHASW